MGSLSIGYVNS